LKACAWLIGWYLKLTLAITDSDYPVGIFKYFIQMYNYILLILVIINSLNCSDIVVNIDTSTNGLFTSICQRQIIKQLFLDVLFCTAYNKLGLGEGSQSQTHRTPSCVPRWEIGIHNDRHLSWDWYIWIVVPHFLIDNRRLENNDKSEIEKNV
jgi:hypothetical protein